MAPKFALFTKGSKLPLNKGFKNMFELPCLALNPRTATDDVCLLCIFQSLQGLTFHVNRLPSKGSHEMSSFIFSVKQ